MPWWDDLSFTPAADAPFTPAEPPSFIPTSGPIRIAVAVSDQIALGQDGPTLPVAPRPPMPAEPKERPLVRDPERELAAQGTFGALFVEPALKTAAHLAPMALRLGGTFGGAVAVPAVPFLGRTLGAAVAEPVAQMIESDLGVAKPSPARGALNVGFAALPGMKDAATPVGTLSRRVAEGAAQNVAYDLTAYALDEGPAPTGESLLRSGIMGGTIGAVFGLKQADDIKRRIAERIAGRLALPMRALKTHQETGGSTYSYDGQNLAGKEGYSVSLYPERSEILDVPLTAEHIDAFVKRNQDLFDADSRNAVGTWLDRETGKTYLDVVVVTKDRDLAIDLGKRYNQKAIFDLLEFKEINTGGTGDPIPNLPPEVERLPPPPSTLLAEFQLVKKQADEVLQRASAWYREHLGDTRGSARVSLLTGDWAAPRTRPGAPEAAEAHPRLFGEEAITSETTEELAGRIGVGLLIGEPTTARPDPKLKTPPSTQAIQANLARLAAADIMSPKGSSFEAWSAKVLDAYGDVVKPHLVKAWRSANSVIERRANRLVKELPSLSYALGMLHEGKVFGGWYRAMHDEVSRIFGADADLFLRLLAATSPNTNINTNLLLALRLYVQYKAGARTVMPEVLERARIMRENVVRRKAGQPELPVPDLPPVEQQYGFRGVLYPEWAVAAINNEPFGGMKVRNFLAALRGDPNAVVIDLWMLRFLGYKTTESGEFPTMSDLEYAINADYIRALAKEAGMTPAEFQERIWVALKRRAGTTERFSELPYHVHLRRRFEEGLPLVPDSVISSLSSHERAVAAAINESFLARGTVGEDIGATGLGPRQLPLVFPEPPKTARARLVAKRSGQRGAVRLDTLLPTWAAIQVLKGVNTFAKFATRAILSFGNGVKGLLQRAWQLGRQRAFRMASLQPDPPPPPNSSGAKGGFTATPQGTVASQTSPPSKTPLTTRVKRETARLRARYGTAGEAMAQLLENNRDLIEEQARGRISDPEMQALARQIDIDLSTIASKVSRKPGTAATPEDVKAWADFVYTVDRRLSATLAKKEKMEPAGTWTPADEAELAALTETFVNAHAVMAGKSAEAGRALRVHRLMRELRNRDLTAFLSIAKQRRLNSDVIGQIMRTHTDPLSRARAVQAMSRLSARDLWLHARYYTMLMDPTTWINAALGNTSAILFRALGKVPGTFIDRLVARGGPRSVVANTGIPKGAAFLSGAIKGWRRALHLVRTGIDPEAVAAGIAPPEQLFVGQPLPVEIAANFPFRALSFVDALTSSIATNAEMYDFAYVRALQKAKAEGAVGQDAIRKAQHQAADWLNNPPEWLLRHAHRLGRQLSLQAPLTKFWTHIETGLRMHPVLTSFLFPFLRTKVNVIREAAKLTPLGYIQAARMRRAARSLDAAREYAKASGIPLSDITAMELTGGPGTFQASLQREAGVIAGTATAGTTAALLAFPLLIAAGLGDITGDPPRDKAEAQRLARERPFNAVRVGNVWISQRSLGALEPILRTLGNAKQAFDIIHRRRAEDLPESQWERYAEATMDSLVGLLRAGPLGDIDNLARVWDSGDPDVAAVRLGEMFKGATIVGEVADKLQRYIDPNVRTVESFFDPLRRAFDPASLPPRLDPLGDPIRKRPWPVVKQIGDRPHSLLNEAAAAGVSFTAPAERTLVIEREDGTRQEVLLGVHDRRVLNRALGLANRRALEKVVGDRESWEAMEPEERRKELEYWKSTLRSDVRRLAQEELKEGRLLDIRKFVEMLNDAA